MKEILIVLIAALSHYTSTAQGFTWAKSFGTEYPDEISGTTIDNKSNLYAIGSLENHSYAFIQKIDANGNFIWQKQLVPIDTVANRLVQAYSVVSNALGYIYIVGGFTGTIDFDPGIDTFKLSSTFYNTFILKLDSNGKFLWVKSVEGTKNIAKSIVLNDINQIYVTGYFIDSVDFDPGINKFKLSAIDYSTFVLKIDSAGNFNWVFSIRGDKYITPFSMHSDKAGNLYVMGEFNGTADFDPGVGTYNLSGQRNFLLKTDSSGNFLWAKNTDHGSMGLDKASNIYLSEYSNHTLKKLDSSGLVLWTRPLPINPYGISVNDVGNIYLVGSFDSTRDFDPISGNYKFTSKGASDAFIAKLDNSGNFIWSKAIGGEGHDWGHTVIADEMGNAYVTGVFAGSVNFDPDSGKYYLASSSIYEQDVFVMKIAYNDVGVEKNEKRNEVIISPNPVKDKLRIQTSSIIRTAIIKDAQGRLIKTINKPGNEINLSYLPAGGYLLQIETEKEQFVHKFLKE